MASIEVGGGSNCQPEVFRPLGNFLPSLWGDTFLSFSLDDQLYDNFVKEIEVLKEETRGMLVADGSKSAKKMDLINTLERLGVSYHFENEIEDQLENIFNAHNNFDLDEDNDLCTIALHFRIFRQHGYKMSCDVFNRFKDNNGKFKETLTSDVMGLLSLYEAAHLSIHGEDILDEALAFTTTHLESVSTHLSLDLEKQVKHALKQPLHTGDVRIEARRYISIYEEGPSKDESLLRFAKLDFNLLQLLHKQELCQVTRWWKDLNLSSKLSHVRDRIVEGYLFAMGMHFEPHYSYARVMQCKTIGIITILDDTYDAYGTIEELEVFTDAMERWDISAIGQLPDYMKKIYTIILDFYQELDEEMTKQGRSYVADYAREAIEELARVYLVEAKWYNKGYVPTFDEYMGNALVSITPYVQMVSSLAGMEKHAKEHAFAWLRTRPNKALAATQTISRLLNDIMSHEEEQEKGDVATGIECYMKQYGGSKEEVIGEFYRRIRNAWKDINEECLRPFPISEKILMRFVGLNRMVDVVYKDNNGFGNPEKLVKDYIFSLFIDPVPA